MPTPRSGAGVAALNDRLYVAGGYNFRSNYQILHTVECFNPSSNSWSSVTSMNIARRDCVLVPVGDSLLAVGGIDKDDNFIASVEVYNPDNDSWTVECGLEGKITGAFAMRKCDLK